MIIKVDVDGVVADTQATLLADYNQIYGDKLKLADITNWGLHRFVKPECGAKVYDLFTYELYSRVAPIRGALINIAKLRESGYEIVFVTTAMKIHAWAKLEWLQAWSFLPNSRDGSDHYVETSNKSLVKGDLLIDDCLETVLTCGDTALLYDQPWNRIGGNKMRVMDWNHIMNVIQARYGRDHAKA